MNTFAHDYRDPITSLNFHYDSIWDARKIMGCACDSSHMGSYDCSESVCPNGDDPLTGNQVNDKQLVKCLATTGSFVLFYKGCK